MTSNWVRALGAGLILVTAGCGGSSGGSSGSAAAAATSPTGSATTANGPVGPLHAKALQFEATMQAQHVPFGLVQDVNFDAQGNVAGRGGPSRCLWTGVYAAAQAQRLRATGDPVALANMEKALWALHDLHEVTGVPGVIARGYDEPRFESRGIQGAGAYSQYNYDHGKPSRDQYAGWFYGVGFCWDDIQDPALRLALAEDARNACDILMANDLEFKSVWNGQPQTFFNLNPNAFGLHNVTPQQWATVDDFPINLIAQSVPYDPALVDALRRAESAMPPIRAGEALRAVLIFSVAAHITGDPVYQSYRDDMLFGARDFAGAIQDYVTIQDDLLQGNNLVVAERTLRKLFDAIGILVQAYLQAQGQSSVLVAFSPLIVQTLGGWLSQVAVDGIEALHDPNNQAKITRFLNDLRTLGNLFNIAGLGSLGQGVHTFLNTYGPHINHQGLVEFSNTIRSYLSTNLTLMPAVCVLHIERDPQVVSIFERVLEKYWVYLGRDLNAMVNVMQAGYGDPAQGANALPDLVNTLTVFPVDLTQRGVDNSNLPGLTVSIWPDRFGRVGNYATNPWAFEIDQRKPDIFSWRSNPRAIVDGSGRNPNYHVAPLSYLAPYWMARERGLIGPAD